MSQRILSYASAPENYCNHEVRVHTTVFLPAHTQPVLRKVGQKSAHGDPRDPKGDPGDPKGGPGDPKSHTRGPSGAAKRGRTSKVGVSYESGEGHTTKHMRFAYKQRGRKRRPRANERFVREWRRFIKRSPGAPDRAQEGPKRRNERKSKSRRFVREWRRRHDDLYVFCIQLTRSPKAAQRGNP